VHSVRAGRMVARKLMVVLELFLGDGDGESTEFGIAPALEPSCLWFLG
jgi:hypothetical protein